MRVAIITSSRKGTASFHIAELLKFTEIEIAQVIFCEGIHPNNKRFRIRKLNKIIKVGILGVVNGVRMRQWYGKDLSDILNVPDIFDICATNNIPIISVPYVNCDKTKETLKALKCDIGVSLGNGYIPASVYSIPRNGMINIHHEILPDYKNAQSVIWQLFNGSTNTGFTIHKIDKTIDTGNILYVETIPIKFEHTLRKTVTSTLALLNQQSSKALVKVLSNYTTFEHKAFIQDSGKSYTTPSFWQFLQILYNYKKFKRLKLK